jgi:hypothetical protein
MKMKYSLLGVSFIGSVLLLAIQYTEFEAVLRDLVGWQSLDRIFKLLLVFPCVLFFSLVTFKLPDRIYRSWLHFAQIAIPLTLLILLGISLGVLHSSAAGSFGWGSIFNRLVDGLFITILLFLFTLGSSIQIYRGYIHSTGGLLKLYGFLLTLGIAIPVVVWYMLG